MPESIQAKAVRALAEDRVRVVKASDAGIAIDVVSSKPDPATLTRPTYRALVYVRSGAIVRECSCPCPKRCYHVAAAELVWSPGHRDSSAR